MRSRPCWALRRLKAVERQLPGQRLAAYWAAALLTCTLSAAVQGADVAPKSVLVVPACCQEVELAIELPKSVAIDSGDKWQLVQSDRPEVAVPVQIGSAVAADGTVAPSKRLYARIPASKSADGVRRFRLRQAASAAPSPFTFKDVSKASLQLLDDGKPVMTYNYGPITGEKVPKTDSRRIRAGYVHPVWGLDGEVLTDDFPKDHYHHHGIFWAWPHVGIDGKEYDLWQYKGIEERFVTWLHRETGSEAAVLAVENGWFVGDRKVMIERVWMWSFPAADGGRAIDFELTWIPVDNAITLRGAEGKSYGGLNFRFAPRKDTLITVPSGPAKEDLPDTPLKWADLSAKFPGAPGPSGAAVFIDPGHPDYPPTWLTRHYGILCVGWPGVKSRTFEPGKTIRMDDRVWIHRGIVDTAHLGQRYSAYEAARAAHWQ